MRKRYKNKMREKNSINNTLKSYILGIPLHSLMVYLFQKQLENKRDTVSIDIA